MKMADKGMGKEEEEIIATLEKIAKKVDEDP